MRVTRGPGRSLAVIRGEERGKERVANNSEGRNGRELRERDVYRGREGREGKGRDRKREGKGKRKRKGERG